MFIFPMPFADCQPIRLRDRIIIAAPANPPSRRLGKGLTPPPVYTSKPPLRLRLRTK